MREVPSYQKKNGGKFRGLVSAGSGQYKMRKFPKNDDWLIINCFEPTLGLSQVRHSCVDLYVTPKKHINKWRVRQSLTFKSKCSPQSSMTGKELIVIPE